MAVGLVHRGSRNLYRGTGLRLRFAFFLLIGRNNIIDEGLKILLENMPNKMENLLLRIVLITQRKMKSPPLACNAWSAQ